MAADKQTGGNGSTKPASDQKATTGVGDQTAAGPSMQVLGQYIRDLSFENPNAPASLQQQQKGQPKLDIDIKIEVRQVADKVHEVTLHLENRLAIEASVLFNLELSYAAAFQIEHMPPEMMHQVLRVQCPTLMFPFLRRLVADLTRDGGFPPLYLDPIDFAQLYMREMSKTAKTEGRQAKS